MSIFDFLKPKPNKPTAAPIDNTPDEEYQLPELSIGTFPMNEEMRRRYDNAMLRERYGVKLKKYGEFL